VCIEDTHTCASTHDVSTQVFDEGPSLMGTTFAAIIDNKLDPNGTLTHMLTKLGSTWHGPQTKNDFLLCEYVH